MKPLYEKIKYINVETNQNYRFHIVSSERNAGRFVLDCLNSVYYQNYSREYVRHIVFDDASTDETEKIINKWKKTHPGNKVEFFRRKVRVGGCKNNFDGFLMARKGEIILELNGDDYFYDSNVLKFLNMIYSNSEVWTTYNTFIYSNGLIGRHIRPFSRRDILNNNYRKNKTWSASHLHTFRQELLNYFDKQCLIDPQTGYHWESADDLAFYIPLLEMSGTHSRHLYRINYVYRLNSKSEENLDPIGQLERADRIRELKPYQPLRQL